MFVSWTIQSGLWQAMAYVNSFYKCPMLPFLIGLLWCQKTLLQAYLESQGVSTENICVTNVLKQTLKSNGICKAFPHIPSAIMLWMGSSYAKKISYGPLWSLKGSLWPCLCHGQTKLEFLEQWSMQANPTYVQCCQNGLWLLQCFLKVQTFQRDLMQTCWKTKIFLMGHVHIKEIRSGI